MRIKDTVFSQNNKG